MTLSNSGDPMRGSKEGDARHPSYDQYYILTALLVPTTVVPE